VAGRAGAGGSLAWSSAWIVLFGRAPSLTSAFASGRLLPSCLASGARGPGCAAGVSADGGRGQRRARSAWRFWAVCRLRAPSAAAIRVQVAPPSRAASMRASSLSSSSAAMRRAAASAVSADRDQVHAGRVKLGGAEVPQHVGRDDVGPVRQVRPGSLLQGGAQCLVPDPGGRPVGVPAL
jgi:hypothetical protein